MINLFNFTPFNLAHAVSKKTEKTQSILSCSINSVDDESNKLVAEINLNEVANDIAGDHFAESTNLNTGNRFLTINQGTKSENSYSYNITLTPDPEFEDSPRKLTKKLSLSVTLADSSGDEINQLGFNMDLVLNPKIKTVKAISFKNKKESIQTKINHGYNFKNASGKQIIGKADLILTCGKK